MILWRFLIHYYFFSSGGIHLPIESPQASNTIGGSTFFQSSGVTSCCPMNTRHSCGRECHGRIISVSLTPSAIPTTFFHDNKDFTNLWVHSFGSIIPILLWDILSVVPEGAKSMILGDLRLLSQSRISLILSEKFFFIILAPLYPVCALSVFGMVLRAFENLRIPDRVHLLCVIAGPRIVYISLWGIPNIRCKQWAISGRLNQVAWFERINISFPDLILLFIWLNTSHTSSIFWTNQSNKNLSEILLTKKFFQALWDIGRIIFGSAGYSICCGLSILRSFAFDHFLRRACVNHGMLYPYSIIHHWFRCACTSRVMISIISSTLLPEGSRISFHHSEKDRKRHISWVTHSIIILFGSNALFIISITLIMYNLLKMSIMSNNLRYL